jgi:hypothetical protein
VLLADQPEGHLTLLVRTLEVAVEAQIQLLEKARWMRLLAASASSEHAAANSNKHIQIVEFQNLFQF